MMEELQNRFPQKIVYLMGGRVVAVLALTELWVHIADGSSLVLGVPCLDHPRKSDRKPLWSTVASLAAHFSPTHT